jgi:hypothetical protein
MFSGGSSLISKIEAKPASRGGQAEAWRDRSRRRKGDMHFQSMTSPCQRYGSSVSLKINIKKNHHKGTKSTKTPGGEYTALRAKRIPIALPFSFVSFVPLW